MNTTRLLCCLGYILLAPFIGGLLDGIDRKLSARMQGRTGPSIFSPFMILSSYSTNRSSL